ncbi:MAG TPA: DUF2274 domain-containing protein [Stellaceae bacterium]|nr:DUF2274 domain-containing protein [Stellaceae bacterium]
MPELKLAKLPDRTPVKIAIIVAPELNRMLQAYAEVYRECYGEDESVPALIPAMLESFLKSDIAFSKAWKERGRRDTAPKTELAPQSVRARHREAPDPPATSS